MPTILLNTPSSATLRHDLVPAAVGASIGLFVILVGIVVFIWFWIRSEPRLRRRSQEKLREKEAEEGRRAAAAAPGRGGSVQGARGLAHGQQQRPASGGQDTLAARTSVGSETVADAEERGDGGWEIVRGGSPQDDGVVKAVGMKGETKAWWKGGRRGWW